MRVIAGRLGGRRLLAPPGRDTRPTGERVREALFSVLGPLENLVVLDLFAGSGALGVEALSRGARRAVFVERSPRAVAALRANLDALGIGAEAADLRRIGAGAALRAARERRETYDLVFLDPPYRKAPALGPELSEALPGVLAPRARVVAESDRRAPMVLDLGPVDERRYGDTLICIYRFPDGPDEHRSGPGRA